MRCKSTHTVTFDQMLLITIIIRIIYKLEACSILVTYEKSSETIIEI
jgi:hypothetical protein